MIDVDVKAGELRLSAQMILNMSAYCIAAHALRESEAKLRQEFDALVGSADKSADEKMEYVAARISPIIQAEFDKQREEALQELRGLNGISHWLEVKKLLGTQCNKENPDEKSLALALENHFASDATVPLVIALLNDSFIELMKNSMDSVIKRYFADITRSTMLELVVVLKLNPQQDILEVTLTDNAGGFSGAYTKYFNNCVEKGMPMQKSCSEKQDYKKFCFGGEGQGLADLFNSLNAARRFDKGVLLEPQVISPIQISNNPDTGGAQISIISPLTSHLEEVFSYEHTTAAFPCADTSSHGSESQTAGQTHHARTPGGSWHGHHATTPHTPGGWHHGHVAIPHANTTHHHGSLHGCVTEPPTSTPDPQIPPKDSFLNLSNSSVAQRRMKAKKNARKEENIEVTDPLEKPEDPGVTCS